jgi:hypothetical protein
LASIDINRYQDELLFFLFYMNCGDIMQLQAAAGLYDRDWRYHMDKRVWLTKLIGVEPQQKTNSFEKGFYSVFDVNQWKRVQIEMSIEYNRLADKPQLGNINLHQLNNALIGPSQSSTTATTPTPQSSNNSQPNANAFANNTNSTSTLPISTSTSATPTPTGTTIQSSTVLTNTNNNSNNV